jgi:hypothetical protein
MASGSKRSKVHQPQLQPQLQPDPNAASFIYKLADIPELFIKVLQNLDQDALLMLKDLGVIKIRKMIFEYVKTPEFLRVALPTDIFDFVDYFTKNTSHKYDDNILIILNYLNGQNFSRLDYNNLLSLNREIDANYNRARYAQYIPYLENIKRNIDAELPNRLEYYVSLDENEDELRQKLETRFFSLESINKMIQSLNEMREPIQQEYATHGNQEQGIALNAALTTIDRKLALLNDQTYRQGLVGGKKRKMNKNK